MVNEAWKDHVEDAGATVVEAGISMIPVIGGPMAVIANKAFAIKLQQRTQKILTQFEEDIEELGRRGQAQTDFLDSEEFLAGVHTFVRAANETSSEEKRQLLRNALLNEHVVSEPRKYPPQFVSLIAQYQPEHVHVLRDVVDLVEATGYIVENPEWRLGRVAKDRGQPEDPFVKNYLDDLVRDGLLNQTEEELRGGVKPVSPKMYVAPTRLGKSFLEYVESPLD